jgi:hypothetical protein
LIAGLRETGLHEMMSRQKKMTGLRKHSNN